MNKTILIVDDDPPCRRSSAELLRAQDWEVIEAGDGEEGIAMAIEHRPTAILCDLLMPRGNGYNLCRAVRGHLDLKHTPVLVMSGRDYATDRQTAAEAGASEYLVKPVGAQELYAALARHVDSDGARRPAGRRRSRVAMALTRLTFWGVRGSIPTPGPGTIHYGGNTSCVEVRADGELIVLDAGTGIRLLGIALAEEFGETPLAMTLLVTHTHWDHIQGFPFFSPAYEAKNRIRVLGYEGASASLAATLAGQMESPYFPIPLAQMPGNLVIEELRELEFKLGKVRVTACYSKHPGVCVGYRLFTSTGSIAYVPDNEWSADEITKLDEGGPCTAESNLLEFVQEADVLIIDAQYSREEYERHVGWGHGCADDVVRLALAARVKHLYLFHHDPRHDDDFLDAMVRRARELVKESGSTLLVDAAREGAKVAADRGGLRRPRGPPAFGERRPSSPTGRQRFSCAAAPRAIIHVGIGHALQRCFFAEPD